MRTTLSTGNYAVTPYYIAGIDIPVYCIEELAYCIMENSFMIDAGLMNDELVEWVGSECGIKELSRQLYGMVHRQGSLSAFVALILEYSGIADESAQRETAEVLRKNAGLSSIEKRKEKIDILVTNKKYVSALRGYDALLAKWDEADKPSSELPAPGVKAALIHNRGVALAGLMQYEQAAECFMESYEISGESSEYVAYLAAKRMGLSESGYIAFAAEQNAGYRGTLQLEHIMEQVNRQWEQQADYQRLKIRRQMRNGSEKQKYYDENERLTQALKENYRECVGE
jgi:tetratricopeptide (TPR) repeat protein